MMSKEETIQLLMCVQAAFPNFKIPNKEVTVNMWHMMLGEYPYQQCMVALQTYIATDSSGFAPSIGQIIDKMRIAVESVEMSDVEAWSLVSKAIRNSAYNADKEFEALPDRCKKVLGGPSQLRIWAMSEDYNESVISSQFMRSYREIGKREQEIARLPENVKNLLITTNSALLPIQ